MLVVQFHIFSRICVRDKASFIMLHLWDLSHTAGEEQRFKGVRYVPMESEPRSGTERYPTVLNEDRVFPLKGGPKSERQRLEGSFETALGSEDPALPVLRPTPYFASWYMTNGGDLL